MPGPSPSSSFKIGKRTDLFVKNEPFLAKLSVLPNSFVKFMKFPSKMGVKFLGTRPEKF